MTTLFNQNGTNSADVLELTVDGIYNANGGNDTINIKGGSVLVYTNSGNNIINVTGGRGHTVKVAENDKESDKINGVEKLNINGADIVDAYLGSGKDEIVLENTNGKNSNGVLSMIHGGAWGDTFTVKDGVKNYQLYGDAGNDVFNISGGSNIIFWGGAANDTFNVTGGNNNKLYGGDSTDTFNISAGNQNMTLGYGNDIVNVTAGNNQKIKANLGINTINLKAGSGHVITADIDKALSKKNGYTDEQIKNGEGLGYGQDKVYISGTASSVTANLGDGRDYVSVSSGSGHRIYTEGWTDAIEISGSTHDSVFDAGAGDDIINISGGTNNVVIGGAGSDTYNIIWTKGSVLTIDNSDTTLEDVEKINFSNVKSSDFTYSYDNISHNLTMKDAKGGSVVMKIGDYLAQTPEAGILTFSDKKTTIHELIDSIKPSTSIDIPLTKTEVIIKSDDIKNGELVIRNASGDIKNLEIYFNGDDLKFSSEEVQGAIVIGKPIISQIKTIRLNDNTYNMVYADGSITYYDFSSSAAGVFVVSNSKNDIDITGSRYNDYIQANKPGDTVLAGDGDDIIKILEKDSHGQVINKTILNGENGDDYICADTGTGHTLIGGNGNDTLIARYQAGGGVDLSGGAGNDKYVVGLEFSKSASIGSGIVTIDQSDAAIGDNDVLVLENASKNSISFSLTSGILSITSTNGSNDSVYVLDWDEHALSRIYFGSEASKDYLTGDVLNNAFKQTSIATLAFGDGSVATYNVLSYDSTSATKTLVITGNKQ